MDDLVVDVEMMYAVQEDWNENFSCDERFYSELLSNLDLETEIPSVYVDD